MSPASAGGFFTTEPPGRLLNFEDQKVNVYGNLHPVRCRVLRTLPVNRIDLLSPCCLFPPCLPAFLTSVSHGCHCLGPPGLLEEPSVLRQTLRQSHSLSRHHKPLPRSASASPSRPCWVSSVRPPRA